MIYGWFVKGSRPTRKYVLCKSQKIHVFGALSTKGCLTKVSTAINRKKFLAFIRRLWKNKRKLCIVIDNARWHLTSETMKFVREKHIKMIRLPPYSPELNPIEQYWKNVKNWLATRMYFDKKGLLREVKVALRKEELVPDLCDY